MAYTGKLTTPVQYEQVLDELNILRPLSLVDTVRRVVSLPIVNAKPVSSSAIARGKVLRCNNGAILTKNNRYGLNDEVLNYKQEDIGTTVYPVTFSQVVKWITCRIFSIGEGGTVQWVAYPTTHPIRIHTRLGIYHWVFHGTSLYIKIRKMAAEDTGCQLQGYY